MDPKPNITHVVFFPFMAAGHMIPILDIAKLFATHNVKTTIITTPLNAPFFLKPLESYNKNTKNCPPIDVEIIPFPSKEAGYPEGIENFEHFTSPPEMNKFLLGCQKFEEPLEKVLEKLKPNCLVADMLFAFATRVAAKFNIPRLVFHGTAFFAQCVTQAFWKCLPDLKSNDSLENNEEVVIPSLPHEIKLKKSQMPQEVLEELMDFWTKALEAEAKSYGVIVNSFYELEPDYVHYYKDVVGRMAWHIGPVSLCNRENEAKFQRGKDSSIDEHECLTWLDSKDPNSVVYICFGSLSVFSNSQLREIVMALEALGQDFIWVVGKISKGKEGEDENEEWLPNGFEERMQGKGLIIRGWAPQILILGHKSIGAFVTHCGWNSILEGISCGVPMVTWPVFAEQHTNEKLVTEILKIGVAVGAKEWNMIVEGKVKWDSIKESIEKVMVGHDALEMRSKVNKLKDMARKAIEEDRKSVV